MSVRPTPGPHDQGAPGQPQPGVTALALRIAGVSVAELDAAGLLRRTCAELTDLYQLAGCAAVLFDPSTGSVRTLIASHPAAEQLTRLVQQLGEGTGSAAIRSGRNTAVEDLTTATRSDLAEAAARVGLPVTGVVALRGAGGLLGCLQLFGAGPGSLSEELLYELEPLAGVLGTALDDAEAYRHSTELVVQLSAALDEQAPIEQAKGIIAERHQVDLDGAYRMLREQARRRELTVRAVAAEVVAQSWRADAAEPGAADQAAVPDQRGVPAGEPETYRAG